MQITKELANNKKFNDIADILLNKTKLVVKDKEYRLCEIEFYYCDETDHHDDLTHCDDDHAYR